MIGVRFPLSFLLVALALSVTFVARSAEAEESSALPSVALRLAPIRLTISPSFVQTSPGVSLPALRTAHEAPAPRAPAPEDRHGVPVVTEGNATFCVLGSLASFVLAKPPQRQDVVTTVVANASAKTIAPSAMATLAVRF